MHQMGDRQLAEAYCDRVYEKALQEKSGQRTRLKATMALSLLAGQVQPGDYEIYLKLVQVCPEIAFVISQGVGHVSRLLHLHTSCTHAFKEKYNK